MPEKVEKPEALNPERTRFRAIVEGRCPRCRTGKMFKHNSFALSKLTQTNTECSNCKQDFVIEPGFYWGAMYISYGVNVASLIGCLIVYLVFFYEKSELYVVGAMIVIVGLLIPINYKYSRILMLHLFSGVKYDRRYVNSVNVEDLEVDFRKTQSPIPKQD